MSKALYGTESPRLDAQLEGMIKGTAVANTTTSFYFNFSACMFNGVQFYAWDSNFGDNLKLSIEYNAGPLGWKRYKKFGKSWYVSPNTKTDIVLFPSEPSNGTRLRVDYECGANAVDFILNGFKYKDREVVDPTQLQEGVDW